jgi:hypothetical protein
MNRFWFVGGLLVLAFAVVIGWIEAGSQGRLVTALVLADVTAPDCDGPGQVKLTLGNADERVLMRVEGVISFSEPNSSDVLPMGNFVLEGPVATGGQLMECVEVDDSKLPGGDRKALVWMAQATSVAFDESASR